MSKYVLKAALSNPAYPEYGQVTVPFPIPDSEYAHTIEMLSAIGIGSAAGKDCRVDEIDSGYLFLNRLEGPTQNVNVDELDYLAKRLDSFDVGEAAQYQAMLYKEGCWKIEDMINLTFCCQQATVITDFSDLEKIGKDHFMVKNGGCARIEDLDRLDGWSEALKLILNEKGTITPSGVMYDNGMKLEPLYQGKEFPAYLYDNYPLVLEVTPKAAPKDTKDITYLYLPSPQEQIDRALERGGIGSNGEARVKVGFCALPDKVREALTISNEPLGELNEMCRVIHGLTDAERIKLDAVMECIPSCSALETTRLAENLELFDLAPHVQTPEELGEYMVKESGHFEYDPNLEGFYGYKKLGEQKMKDHPGHFTSQGYISYEGAVPFGALLTGEQQSQDQQMM